MARELTLLLLALAACGGPRYAIEYDYDGDASFDNLKRYRWYRGKGSVSGNERVDKLLEESLDKNLERMGLERIDEGTPDFWVTCVVETRRKVGTREIETRAMMDTHFGYENYYFDGSGGTETAVIDYVEGSIIVDIAVKGGKKPIWRGWAHGVIREGMSDQQIRAEATEVFRRILEKFPPPATRKKK
ncbi:MAG: DUF4136 domain-containing protein [Planctomycetota bacterium]